MVLQPCLGARAYSGCPALSFPFDAWKKEV
jgi:hypothetical protein